MNVTLKLDDEVLQEARHRAVDQRLSLSAWMTKLLERELQRTRPRQGSSILEQLGDERLADVPLELPSHTEPFKEINW